MQTYFLKQKTLKLFSDNRRDNSILMDILPNLFLVKKEKPSLIESSVFIPFICLILQGNKEIIAGDRSIQFGVGQCVIGSQDLPAIANVKQASPDNPHIALVMSLDMELLRGLYAEVDTSLFENTPARSLELFSADDALVNALERYLDLADCPEQCCVMAPLILKEIHFRLLMSPGGGMLRSLLQRDSHASRIARAISKIRMDFRNPLAIADLANVAGMSPSSFHEHFKAVTDTTPLQYQKGLRLIEARRLIADANHSISSAAFSVGYESPTQFSREYARKFGASPRNDFAQQRIAS